MECKVRFAPSPTGYLHLGNVRVAILNYLFAKKNNGKFLLRIDNTDITRVKPEYITSLKEDLKWLNLNWDETFEQLNNLSIYNEVCKNLIKDGLLYACYETKEELENFRLKQKQQKKPPIYNRKIVPLSKIDENNYIKQGRKPYFRLKILPEEISWIDMIKNKVSFHGKNISDPIVIREDGSYLYMLTSVIDDVSANITHILRGEDHISNTAIQIQIFKHLSNKVPVFAHFPLIATKNGEGLSKRNNSLSIQHLKGEGYLPMSINNYLSSLGKTETNTIFNNVEELANDFDITLYQNSGSILDVEKLERLNIKILINKNFNDLFHHIKKVSNIEITENFWNVIKNNISSIKDIKHWHNILHSINIENSNIIDKNLQQIMLKTYSSDASWKQWLEQIKKESSLKGRDLFINIRNILTHSSHGPNLEDIVKYMKKDILLKRLKS